MVQCSRPPICSHSCSLLLFSYTRAKWPVANGTTTTRCQIACPPFMSVGYLEQVLRRERDDAAVFTPLPHHYLEIASLLLNTASDDIGELSVRPAILTLVIQRNTPKTSYRRRRRRTATRVYYCCVARSRAETSKGRRGEQRASLACTLSFRKYLRSPLVLVKPTRCRVGKITLPLAPTFATWQPCQLLK